jgi:hypothetical protein
MKIKNKIIISITAMLLFISFMFYTIDGYQRAFLALRVKNYFVVPDLSSPSDIYSIPENWLRDIDTAYIPEEPRYPQHKNPVETDVDPNSLYRMKLMKSGLGEISRDLYDKSLSDREIFAECSLSLKHCLGFLPVRNNAQFTFKNSILFDRNGIKMPLKILNGEKNKILIALHGKGGSPEGVICQVKDYSNCYGSYWNQKGYTVYAPAIEGRGDWAIPRLNLDSFSSDLAKIEDLIYYLKFTKGHDTNIYIAGISYGANLAEYSAALFEDIDGLISIGGEGRYIFGESEFSLPTNYTINTNRNRLRNGKIFNLIPSEKPILISVGINDAGLFNDDGYGKLKMLNKLNAQKNIRFHFFNGGHESDPAQEFKIFSTMIAGKN